MGSKLRQQQRALARVDKRPSSGSQPRVIEEDPVGIGPDRSITINMAKLPAPSNAYDADYAWLEHKPGDVRFFFAKRHRDASIQRLRTCLEIRYPPESLVGHFWRNSRDFHEKMKRFAESWPADEKRADLKPSEMDADKEHSEWANFESMAHAGSEAVIDFYSLPPSGLARYNQGVGSSGLTITPIVRVQLSIFELVRLLDSMSSVIDEVTAYLPTSISKNERLEQQQ
jgi:hypothetical protein